jgi:hypothetical protein
MALNFGAAVNTQLLPLAGLNPATVDPSTLEIVAIDPAQPNSVVRATITATIPTPDLIGALIAYFSPPGSTSVTAAVVVHGDGTVTPAAYAAANTWAALTSAGTEVSGGSYVRQPLTWVTNDTTGTAAVAFNVPTGVTVDGVAFTTSATASLNAPVTVASQPFTTPNGGIYTAAITYNET